LHLSKIELVKRGLLGSNCLEGKYNEILTNDYYASLRASYTFKELKNFTLENDLSSLDVFEEGENYLIVYGNV